METNKNKDQKRFKKVKEKVNVYKSKNLILNSPYDQEKINDNIINTKIEKEIDAQKNLDFINNSNIIKEAVAYSKLRKLKKNLAYKNNNSTFELYNTFSQRNDNINSIKKENEIINEKNYKKITYDSKDNNLKENNQQELNPFDVDINNDDYKATTGKNGDLDKNIIRYDSGYINDDIKNKNLGTNYARISNYDLHKKNKNILTENNENDSRFRITERKRFKSIEKFFLNKHNNYNKNSEVLKNKNNNNNDDNRKLNYSNSFLNITVNQIRECPLFEKIKMPKMGHSKGIIEMIKNFKDTSSNKRQIEKYEDKNKKVEKGIYRNINKNINKKNKENNNDNNKNKNIDNNIGNKKKVKCLNDQKVFDEPKNKTYISNNNYSYQKKILKKNKNNSTNKKKNMFKKQLTISGYNNKILGHNKTLSFNNNFEIKPALTFQDDLSDNYKNDQDEDIINKVYNKKDNLMYMKYINNNIRKARNSLYKRIKKSKAININYNPKSKCNQTNSNIDINFNNNNDNKNIINITNTETESDIINKTNNNNRTFTIASPLLNNKMNFYRNRFIKDNFDQDYPFYQTLSNLSRTLKRTDSNSSYNSNKIEEIKINMKNNKNKKNIDKKDIINRTNSYFYNRDNLAFLKEPKNELSLQEEENDYNFPLIDFNLDEKQKMPNNRNNKNNINKDNSLEIQKKLFKTNSSIDFKNKKILYLKPRNKKNLKSINYSNFNYNNNNNIDIKNNLSNPLLINTNDNNNQLIDNNNSKLNTNDNDNNNNTDNTDIDARIPYYSKGKHNKFIDINDVNDKEILFNKKLRQKSLNKSPNKVYKKPINKSILNISKKTPNNKDNNIDSNSLTCKDEIIYVDKITNTISNSSNVYRQNNNNNNNMFQFGEDFNRLSNINNDFYEIPLKIISKNNKNGLIKKFYNHCIKTPIIGKNYFTKKNMYRYRKNIKKIKNMQRPYNPICYFTKVSIKSNKNNKENQNNKSKEKNKEHNKSKENIQNKNKFLKIETNIIDINAIKNINNNNENIIKINKLKEKENNNQSSKILKEKINLDNNKSHNIYDKNILNKKDEKIDKYTTLSQKENIKNEIIYLLNILTSKNILNIENQLTKLIITSSHVFNIENNQDNAKLFLSDIINNENIFIEVLVNKVIIDDKYIEIYSKLCSDLCNKYLNSINEILVNKFIDSKENNNYNIINNLKSKLNEECTSKFENLIINDINNENKQVLFNLIDFICYLLENDITNVDACLNIIYQLLNKYEQKLNNKYYYLDIILYFLLKLEKIKQIKNENKIIQKITSIINNDIDNNNITNDLKSRINKYKKIFKIEESHDSELENQNNYNFKGIALLIKEDIDKYIKDKEQKENVKYDYNSPILSSLKKIDLEEIINHYIIICIHVLSKHEQIIYYNSYIKNIIESITYKLSLNKLRAFHNNMLQILSNINTFCSKNKHMYEIIGYLIYFLIVNELCDIEDINIFINKDEESKIIICKTIKYTILASEDNIKKYYEEFKNIDLFKNNNNIFDQYITCELKNLLNL